MIISAEETQLSFVLCRLSGVTEYNLSGGTIGCRSASFPEWRLIIRLLIHETDFKVCLISGTVLVDADVTLFDLSFLIFAFVCGLSTTGDGPSTPDVMDKLTRICGRGDSDEAQQNYSHVTRHSWPGMSITIQDKSTCSRASSPVCFHSLANL